MASPEPYMVQGKPSPLPAPRLRQTGGRQASKGGGDFRLFTIPSTKFDELVKSHIPYVVHASTKPVLSEPSTLRQAQGERWVEALSTNGISIGYPALRGIHPEPVEG